MTANEKELPQQQHLQQTQDTRRRCPSCAAFARLTHTVLNSRTGKTVRLYRCDQCGERIWDD